MQNHLLYLWRVATRNNARVLPNRVQYIEETVVRGTGMTDNTDATGFKDLTATLPAGALVLGWRAKANLGWIGNTSATLLVGVSGDLNRFSAVATGSVFATDAVCGSQPASDATAFCNAETAVRVTVTGATDFTNISAGSLTLRIAYIAMADLVA